MRYSIALTLVTLAVMVPDASMAQTRTPVRTVAIADSTPVAAPASRTVDRNKVTIQRETFTYAREGRRDPFVSLMSSSELRPMISDLRLVVVVYDPDGGSRAVLRDINSNDQYKVRVGQQLGRMRVARIAPKAVTFTILEFGESRQETLALNDSTTARTP